MIRPYVNARPRPVMAIATEPGWVLNERGRRARVQTAIARDWSLWAEAEQLRAWTRAGQGSAVLWRFSVIGWAPDPRAERWPVRALQVPVPADPGEAVEGLARWAGWLCEHRAAPAGSLGGSGLSLLRGTLRAPLWTSCGVLPPIRYTLGGRQQDGGHEGRPCHYRGALLHCDRQAAYAATLAGVRYGGRWERFGWRPVFRLLCEQNPDVPVYARARVEIPELDWWQGPLPVRPRSPLAAAQQLFWTIAEDVYPVGRSLQGTWSWPELMQAEAAGCRIRRVLDVWVHGAGTAERPFEPWARALWQGRGLGGFAGLLAKVTGNATIGQFAISKGTKKVVTGDGQERVVKLRGGNPSQRAFDLAEWVAGSVRADLHRGIVQVGDRFVTAHTDGLWSRGRAVLGWRVKAEADELRVFNPQTLAYRVGGEPWTYVVAGVLDPELHFEQRWQEALDTEGVHDDRPGRGQPERALVG
jgi:hypothetical protein